MLNRRQFLTRVASTIALVLIPIRTKQYSVDEIFRNDVFNNENLWFLQPKFLSYLYSRIKVPFVKESEPMSNWAYIGEYDMQFAIKAQYTEREIFSYLNAVADRINKEYAGLLDMTRWKGESVYFFYDENEKCIHPETQRVFRYMTERVNYGSVHLV